MTALLAAISFLRRIPAALSFLKRVPPAAWYFALAVALVVAHQVHVGNRTDARTRVVADSVYAAARDAASLVFPAERAIWRRREDSLRGVIARQDSALQQSITRVRRLLEPVRIAGSGTASTPTVPTIVPPVSGPFSPFVVSSAAVPFSPDSLRAACQALAIDCENFRRTALTRFAVSDSLHRADSLSTLALAMGLNASRASLARAVKWRNAERGGCLVSVAANVFQAVRQ